MFLHISYPALENCQNPNVYEICLKCNSCGRWGEHGQEDKDKAEYPKGEGA